MSHFTVLVIGEDPEKQLAPFHEFECTGQDDEYVQDIDRTEEVRKEFEKGMTSRYKDKKGKLYDPYNDKFYRDPTPEELKKIGPIAGTGCSNGMSFTSKDWGDGKGYRSKIHFLPNGWKEVNIKRSKVESFLKFVEDYNGIKVVPYGQKPNLNKVHKYGYALLNKKNEVLKVVNRTNPNRKWDWYQLGGRWTGFFKVKSNSGVAASAGVGAKIGEPGLMTSEAEAGTADQIHKRDVDFQAMRDEAADEAGSGYDKIARLFGGKIPEITLTWEKVMGGKESTEKKRAEYHAQPALVALKAIRDRENLSEEDKNLVIFINLEKYQGGRDVYVGRAIRDAFTTFAVVKDGKWYERGEMGWWACVSNEKDKGEWANEVYKLLESVPDDTLLSMFDCHI